MATAALLQLRNCSIRRHGLAWADHRRVVGPGTGNVLKFHAGFSGIAPHSGQCWTFKRVPL
jgi:hypothetical protein